MTDFTRMYNGIQKIYRLRPEREPRFSTFELPNSKQTLSTGAHMYAELESQGGGGRGGYQFCTQYRPFVPLHVKKHSSFAFKVAGGREEGRERVLIVYIRPQVR